MMSLVGSEVWWLFGVSLAGFASCQVSAGASKRQFTFKIQETAITTRRHTLEAFALPLPLRRLGLPRINHTRIPPSPCFEYRTRTIYPALHLATITLSSILPRAQHLRMNHQPTSPMYQPHHLDLHRALYTEVLSMPTTHSLVHEERR